MANEQNKDVGKNSSGYKVPDVPLVLNPNSPEFQKAYGNDGSSKPIQPATQQAVQDDQKLKTYTVQAGDTLSKIAKKFLGDTGRYTEIYAMNRDILNDPDKIFPGQVLKLPSTSAPDANAKAKDNLAH